MIHSMTGFARREASGPWGQLTCELRSVNHRYLEPSFRLPEELRGLEGELRQTLAKLLRRGKVDCSVHLRSAREAERELRLDETALVRVLERAREVASRAGGSSMSLDPLDVLRWPGVLQDSPPDSDALAAACRALFAETARELAAARTREGVRLREFVLQRLEALGVLVATARTRAPELRERLRTRLQTRLAELDATVDAHLDEIRRVVDGDEAAGRRLDFLMQELNREANTFASKSQEIDSTRLAVDMKVLIEQLREQVQNIE